MIDAGGVTEAFPRLNLKMILMRDCECILVYNIAKFIDTRVVEEVLHAIISLYLDVECMDTVQDNLTCCLLHDTMLYYYSSSTLSQSL